VDFVERVTTEGTPDFVAPAERIAVFDNDGTLWCEQPIYVQLAFVQDRIKALASEHPEWADTQPYQAVLENDKEALAAAGKKGLLEMIAATHAGMNTEAFESLVTEWLLNAKHPTYDQAYTTLVYQPMREVLQYLRANGFKTYIVSGGGVEFMRPFTEGAYGIPPEQVIGSSIVVKYESDAASPSLERLPEINFIDDKAGKPVGIHYHIGRRPIMAFGNSDGDFEMLEWTTTGDGPRMGVLVHHDDAEREYAYDRDSHIGRLDRSLDEAPDRGWVVVSMKNDWQRVFPSGSPN
jgi:phosphoglycolate phosphatase-like HAD superfamily hydrolase